METQVLEGTFIEVQRRLSALPLKPDARLRVIVTEPERLPTPEETLFANASRRNGLILQPAPNLSTSEQVQEALYRADMEDALGEDWEEKLMQMQNSPSSHDLHTKHTEQSNENSTP